MRRLHLVIESHMRPKQRDSLEKGSALTYRALLKSLGDWGIRARELARYIAYLSKGGKLSHIEIGKRAMGGRSMARNQSRILVFKPHREVYKPSADIPIWFIRDIDVGK